jgi:hypothetical protein
VAVASVQYKSNNTTSNQELLTQKRKEILEYQPKNATQPADITTTITNKNNFKLTKMEWQVGKQPQTPISFISAVGTAGPAVQHQ